MLVPRPVAAATDKLPPNIVVIMADDLGYGDLSLHGCREIATPRIDSIAKNGVRFVNGYVSGPVCSPSRAALLTGMYQQRHGDEQLVGKPENKDGLCLAVKTLPQRLGEAGYVSGAFGKWHLGEIPANQPLARGFNEFYGMLAGGRSYLPMDEKTMAAAKAKPTKGDTRIWRNREVAPEPEYTTDAFADEAISFMKRNQKAPFFVYLSFNAVHTPNQAAPKYLARFKDVTDVTRRKYLSRLAAMDDAVGRVLDAVNEMALSSRTVVFFVNDNGGPVTWVAANGSRNTPLRGGKAETWEGGIRVPFFVQWPGTLAAGTTCDAPVIQMDITATAMALAGLKADPQLDGIDLMPCLTGKTKALPHEALCWRFYKNRAIRQGDWKLVDSNDSAKKLPQSGWMLFNLANDPEEQHDVRTEHPEKSKELEQLWEKWTARVDRDCATLEPRAVRRSEATPTADEDP